MLTAHTEREREDFFCMFFAQAVALSFGFSCPPKVNLQIDSNAAKFRKKGPKGMVGGKGRLEGRGSGHGFSSNNPYGKRGEGDRRQLVHI